MNFLVANFLFILVNLSFFKFSQDRQNVSVSLSRLLWFKGIVLNALYNSGNYSRNIEKTINSILDLPFDPQNEIDYNTIKFNEKVFPDIEAGERELLDLELRMSKIQILLLFVPITFAIISLMMNLDTLNQLGLMLNVIALIYIYEKFYIHDYELAGWTKLIEIIKSNRDYLISTPYSQIMKFPDFFQDVFSLEIGDTISPLHNNNGSSQAAYVIFNLLLNFDNNTAASVLDEFLRATKNLPTIEGIVHQKKDVYTKQFYIISIAISVFIVIMSSLILIFSHFYQHYKSSLPINFFFFTQDSPALGYFTIIINICLVYISSNEFFDYGSKIRFTSFLLVFSSILFLGISTTFISLLSF